MIERDAQDTLQYHMHMPLECDGLIACGMSRGPQSQEANKDGVQQPQRGSLIPRTARSDMESQLSRALPERQPDPSQRPHEQVDDPNALVDLHRPLLIGPAERTTVPVRLNHPSVEIRVLGA